MNIGYARVSTEDQSVEIQIQRLQQQGCKKLFQEKLSGGTRERPELKKMLEQLREGDTITVTKLDRLARSTSDLLDIAEIIRLADAGLKSLDEPWADTTSPAGKMILTVFSGIAEFEKSLILERTGAGRHAAKKRGVKFGRKPSLKPEQIQLAKKLISEGKTVKEVAALFEIHKTTLYRAIKPNQ